MRQEIYSDGQISAEAFDLQWQIDQYVLGCGGEGSAAFDRDAFERSMLQDPDLALRVAEAVEEWELIGEAARSPSLEVRIGAPSVQQGTGSLGFKLGVLAASVLLLLGSAALWYTQQESGDGLVSGFASGFASGVASSAPTGELADSWLALSPQLDSLAEMEPLDGSVAESFEDDWFSVQAAEDEATELENDWMLFGAEVFADEADISDA